MSRGLNNNNPLNIRKGGDLFQGEVYPSKDPAFKQFKTPEWGYRAAFVTLATYLQRGLNNVEKIIKTWAPPTENHTASYITTVVQRSGVGRKKVLSASSGSDYCKIVAAMSYCENGVDAVMSDVEAGFKLQNKIK